jgi:predicted Zn-dependent protease
MLIGDRPETGLFVGQLFIHPALEFEMDFPKGWHLQNSSRAVGAIAPRGEAAVFLSADVPPGDLIEAADEFAKEAASDYGIKLTEKKRVKIGKIEGVRYGFQGGARNPISAKVTFFPFAESNWRMVGVAPRRAENRYFGAILLSMRSFRPLTARHRNEIRIQRLHIVLARPGENLVAFNRRTGNILGAVATGLFNGRLGNEIFEGGELMKVVRVESVDVP